MILDLPRFLAHERPFWDELAGRLSALENDPGASMSAADLTRLHFLYQRASADLGRVSTFASEPELVGYLESLVARAYGEIHETRRAAPRLRPVRFLLQVFPRAVRRHGRALALAAALTVVGAGFGALAVGLDPQARGILLPFANLQGDPRDRVAKEERAQVDSLQGHRMTFASALMTHNIRVSILSFALGLTWGVGTAVLLFYNGVILGAVSLDYLRAGEGRFLLAWLLPHGAVEIPAFVLAGQAGLVLASALIGSGNRLSMRRRLRETAGDLVTLLGGVAVLLAWAGVIESFLSQHHEPVLPYGLKIAFGFAELFLLALVLFRAGRKPDEEGERA